MEDERVIDTSGAKSPRRRLLVRAIGLAMVIASVVLGTYLLVAFLAWETGQDLRAEQEQVQSAEQIARQVELAQQDVDKRSFNLALDRLEWVLGQDPENAPALALRQRIIATREATLVEPTAAPEEPTDEPTPDATLAPDAAALQPELDRIEGLVSRQKWDEALPALLGFQYRYPSTQRPSTDRLLYDTYLNLGLETIQTEKVGLGLNYLSQAERLGDLPQEAKDYRFWAELYLDAISYYGVNWQIASDNFRELCYAAPFYQGSCDRLFVSLVNYGDQLAYLADWCPAASVFEEAWSMQRTDELGGKLDSARTNCAGATTVPLTDTAPLPGTEGAVEPPPAEATPGG